MVRFVEAVAGTAAAALLLVLPGCGGPATSAAGPLRLPQQYGFMAAPLPGGTFSAFDVCASGRARRVRLVDVEAGRVVGAEAVSFKVAWPRPGRPLDGAGPLPVEPGYADAVGATGVAPACGDMTARQMSLAVVLPPARDRAVVVRNVRLTYRVGQSQYTALARVRLGTCASDPPSRSQQPAECRPQSG